jgi:hypothetical protein
VPRPAAGPAAARRTRASSSPDGSSEPRAASTSPRAFSLRSFIAASSRREPDAALRADVGLLLPLTRPRCILENVGLVDLPAALGGRAALAAELRLF